jgi:xanthine phosphoribosyltransferase
LELLQKRIASDGRALSESVLLVDSFLNHQVDSALMLKVGEEFAARFADAGIGRVATIESSGIAPAVMTALTMNLPMVIMKKSVSSIMKEGIIQTEVFSFTKNSKYLLTLKAQFVPQGERVLIIDDFLANGEAAFGAIRLVEEAGGTVAG